MTQFGPLPPPYGGVAVHVQRLHELLLEDGFDSRVVTFGVPVSRSMEIHLLRHGPVHWPADLATLVRVVGRGGVVHSHSQFAAYPKRRILEPLILVAKLWKMRWVETFHDQTIIVRFPQFSSEARRLFVTTMANATRIIAIGDGIRDFLVDVGVPEARIVVGQPLLPPREEPPPLTDRYAQFFADHSPVWITIGAPIPLYDFATVATAFRQQLLREPGAGLVTVSAGFAVDRSYEREVRWLLSDLGDRVMFVEDIPNDQVEALLRRSSLLIRGAQLESFGLSRIEGVLAGIPVVATDTGQTRYMTLYRHGDVDSLLAAASLACDLGADTLRAAAAYYTKMATQSFEVILKVYEELGARSAFADVPR